MSDRIAVFSTGRIEQVGTPREIYEHPANEFVAAFVGISNVLERDGERVVVRPEKVRFVDAGEPGVVREVVYLGSVTRYLVELDSGQTVVALRQNSGLADDGPRRGERVQLAWGTHLEEVAP